MSMKKTVWFILKWVVILFIITVLFSVFFITNKNSFITGLIIGTVMSLLRFIFNVRNFSQILSSAKTLNFNNTFLMIFNIFFLMLFFLIMFVILNRLSDINVLSIVGLLIGFSYIPIVIIVGNILESLYIIRNKLY